MKTATSIPDDVYRQAEYLAKKQGQTVSRDDRWEDKCFMHQQKKLSITEQLNKVYANEPDHRRPVLILQSDLFNQSTISTVLVAPLTTNLRLVFDA